MWGHDVWIADKCLGGNIVLDETTFTSGNLVTWANPDLYILRSHGTGPFLVVDTMNVPARACTCGLDESLEDEPYLHFPDCEVEKPSLVGHSQWATLLLGGKEHVFSGAYLVHA